jgi:hypothetical protein
VEEEEKDDASELIRENDISITKIIKILFNDYNPKVDSSTSNILIINWKMGLFNKKK